MSVPEPGSVFSQVLSQFEAATGQIAGRPVVQRHLSDLRGCFVDCDSYESALRNGDPLLYTLSSFEPGRGPGDLHYALANLMPGRIGSEYYLTKGHFHAWREAGEFYLALAGEGMMLLEDESSRECKLVPLRPQQPVYIPGHTAHRTINTGTQPLTYLGFYPANAGHDYGAIAQRNFRMVLLEQNGRPVLLERDQLLRDSLKTSTQKAQP